MTAPTRLLVPLVLMLAVACKPPSASEGEATDAGGGDGGDAVDANELPDASGGQTDAAPLIDARPAVTCDAMFRLEGHAEASEVWVTGSFTNWAGTVAGGAEPMTFAGDAWTATVTVEEGTHQYKFVVDGSEWIADPDNPDQAPDDHGGHNSVYECP